MGINAGHELRFSNAGEHEGPDSKSINAWTGKTGAPYFNMVQNTLGPDGYPVLAAGNRYASGATTTGQSLAYLFDSSQIEGKAAYRDVRGLVQFKDGYYTYDSSKNFASYNEDTGNFLLYNTYAVNNDAGTVAGQFFPFNTGAEVFDLNADGTIKPKNIKSTNGKLNHYFGAELTADFKQPAGGKIGGTPMTFDFAGDDDVWLFIDGVLVGDLGGIHGAASMSINFQTGEITLADSRPNPATSWGSTTTTIRAQFEAALGADAAAEYLKEGTNTLRDDSYHTLKFYYLERGNTDSNMKLTFNLLQATESSVEKDNQRGEPIPGVGFELYLADKAADGTYTVSSKYSKPISTGTTDDNGKLVFKTPDGTRPLNFAELYGENAQYFILKEVSTPEGYHKSADAWLRYVPSNGRDGDGFLISDNLWQTGTYMAPAQVTSFNVNNHNGEVATSDLFGQTQQWIKVDDSKTMFAVLYKRDPATSSPGATWYPILGSAGDWSVDTSGVTSATHFNELYRNGDAKPFTFENDTWSVDLGILPGRVTEYPFMASESQDNTNYRIAYYLVDMPRDELEAQLRAGGNPITDSNTYLLESDGKAGNFTRTSYAKMHVTNVENKLVVQKVDDEGTPVRGAVFDLYRAADMNSDASAPNPGAVPYRTQTTADMTHESPAWMDGAAAFKALPEGTYYLVERSAPAGYVRNEQVTRVIVDGTGVYADAGEVDDGVTVEAGVGTLVDSMDDFGRNDHIEVTLHDIQAQRALASVSAVADQQNVYQIDGWTEVAGTDVDNQVHLRYNDAAATDGSESMTYLPDRDKQQSDATTFTADTGIVGARIRQDSLTEGMQHNHGIGTWYDLGDQLLNNLYSGYTAVRVENQRTSSLEVEKKVSIPDGYTAPDGLDDIDFTMRYTFTDAAGKTLPGSFTARVFKTVDGVEVQQGHDFKLASGDTHTLKNGETLKVYGLPEGTNYQVSEPTDTMPEGFTQAQPSNEAGEACDATGQIAAPGETPVHRVFMNRYLPAPAQIPVDTLGVQKIFTADASLGDPWDLLNDGEGFTFVLQGSTDTEPMPDDAQESGSGHLESTLTVTRDDKGADPAFSKFFQSVRFDTPGEYKYEVFERTPTGEDRVPGVAYSDASYTVCVTVTENTAKRRLEASVAVTRIYTDEGAEVSEVIKPQDDGSFVLPFTNTAQRQSATVSALATKRLTGRDIVTGEFGFRMDAVPLDDEQAAHFPMPAGAQTDPETGRLYVTTINAGSQVSFGQITFTDADYGESVDYYYELSEIVPDDAVNADGVTWAAASEHERAAGGFAKDGVTYTSQHYIMWVHLEYAGADDGIMTATVTYYRGDWPATGQSGLGGAGHEEFVPADHGVNGVLFENEYRSSFHTNLIQVTKRLIGRAMTAEDGFEIVAEGSDEASASLLKTALTGGDGVMEGSKLVFRPGAAADGELVKMSAGSLTLTQDDAGTAQNPKVYTWVISERIPSDDEKLPGVTYDRKQLRLQFSVVDDQKGTIQVTPTLTRMYDTDGTPDGSRVNLDIIFDRDTKRYSLDFTNVFEAKETYTGVDVLKTMTGREMRDGEFQFRAVGVDYQSELKLFELYQKSPEEYAAEQEFGAPAADDGATVRMEKLRGLTFTQDDVRDGDNWYSYYYVESLPSHDDDAATAGIQQHGVTFDETAYRVDISPRLDEQTGALYTITEVYQGLRDQWFPDTPVATFDSRDGTVPELAFENSYKAAPVTVRGAMLTKKLEGRDWQADDTFNFRYTQESYQADGVTMKPGDAGYVGVDIPDSVVDASSEGTGTEGVRRFGFADVVYSEPGVYTYTVRENKPTDGGLPGVAYSDEVARVTVTVVDLGRGRLLAFPQASDIEDGRDAHFTNVYTPQEAAVSTDGLFSKTLAGRAWHENETFTFDMRALDPADAPLPAGAVDGVASVKVGADNAGAFGFGSIAFGAKDMAGATSRTFRYAVSERVPDDAVNADGVRWKDADASQRAAGGFAKDGMTYDAHEAIFAVTVTDDGAGALQASAPTFEGEGTPQAFENAYAASGSIEVAGTKRFTGADLKAGQFTFNLSAVPVTPDAVDAAEGASEVLLPLGTATNKADGSFAFDAVPVTLAQLHEWAQQGYAVHVDGGASTVHKMRLRVAEDTSSLPGGVSAEKNYFNVVVTITDNGDGTLSTDCLYPDSGAEIVNEYSAGGPVTVQPAGVKQLVRADGMNPPDITGAFTFKLAAVTDGAPMPAGDGATAANDAEGRVQFGAISFGEDLLAGVKPGPDGSRERTFTYRVTESGQVPGVENDAAAATGKEFSYTLTDDGAGHLSVTADPADGPQFKFVNTYRASAVTAQVRATKALTGRNLQAGEFSFVLAAQDGSGAVLTADNAADGSVVFDGLTFTTPGIYRYSLRELPGDAGGVAYDDAVYTVHILVTDEGTGALAARVVYLDEAGEPVDGAPVFENAYTATPVSVELGARKELSGRGLRAGEFAFKLTEQGGDGVELTAENDAAGQVAFDAIEYRAAGEHVYTLAEVAGDEGGVTYDAAVYTVHVAVSDDGAGALHANVRVTDAAGNEVADATPTFENAYAAAPVSVELGARKELSGRDLRAGEFTFALTEQGADASVLTAVNDAQGRVAFDELVFSEPGEHIYTMAEVAPDAGAEAGVTYDATVYTVRVAVTDDGAGTLHADTTVLNGTEPVDGTPTFSNTYTAELDYDAAQALGISKVLDGRAMAAGQFGFTMQAADAAAAKVLGIDEDSLTREVTVPAAADGTAARVSLLPAEGVTLMRDDAGKTYRYTVHETRGGGAGYTNDETVYTVEITVVDNGDGTLTATTRATGTNGFAVQSVCTTGDASQVQAVELPFENAYAAAGSLAVTARKELTGRDLRAGEFTFALDLLSMSTSEQDARRLGETVNAADGSISFEPIALDIAELKQLVADGYATTSTGGDGAAWQLRLRVSEDASELPAGVSAQVPSVELAATVRDAGDGTLAVELAEPAGGAVLKNVYSAGDPVAVTPVGAKVLAHAEGLAPASIAGKFTFTLEAVTDGAPMPEGAGAQAVNDEAGNVVFGSISFGQELLAGVTPGPDGSREKAFTYRVRESGQVPGVENDAAASAGKEFTYILRDDGAGRLSVAADPADGPAFTFTNTYTASPVSVGVTARKELSGRPLRDGEFAFTLVEQGGSGVELTADSDAAGTVAFDQLTFTEPGEHVCTLAEVVPGAGDAADGVAYDAAVYTVRVTVADDGAGKLVASVRVTDAAGNEVAGATPTFSNAYEPQGAAAVVAGTKVLTGRDLADGEFTFELVDADGQVLQTVQNAADGQVVFAPLTYGSDDLADASWVSQDGSVSRSRTFAYAVREQVPADAVNADGVTWAQASEAERAAGSFAKDNVTYDGVARPVTVTVSDDGSGGLRASVAWGGLAVFTNAYERPSVPWVPIEPSEPVDPDGPDEPTVPGDPATPQEPTAPGDTEEPDVPAGSGDLPGTGDEALGVVALAAVGGAAAVGVGTWLRRRKR